MYIYIYKILRLASHRRPILVQQINLCNILEHLQPVSRASKRDSASTETYTMTIPRKKFRSLCVDTRFVFGVGLTRPNFFKRLRPSADPFSLEGTQGLTKVSKSSWGSLAFRIHERVVFEVQGYSQ